PQTVRTTARSPPAAAPPLPAEGTRTTPPRTGTRSPPTAAMPADAAPAIPPKTDRQAHDAAKTTPTRAHAPAARPHAEYVSAYAARRTPPHPAAQPPSKPAAPRNPRPPEQQNLPSSHPKTVMPNLHPRLPRQ